MKLSSIMAPYVWIFVETMQSIVELFKGILETNFHKTSQKLNHVIEGIQKVQGIETKFIWPNAMHDVQSIN